MFPSRFVLVMTLSFGLLSLAACGGDSGSNEGTTGACSCGESVCGFDACGNSCGPLTQLELQGEDADGISCDTHTTCDGSLGFACASTALGRRCARVSQFCSKGQLVSTDSDDDGVPDCDEVVFQEQTAAAFLRKSGGEERIYFQATSAPTDATKPGEPPFNRLVIEYAYDVFDAATLPATFDLVPTASKDCKLCVRGSSFCNESSCAWDYVAEAGEVNFDSSGLEDGTCGPGTGSGSACEADEDCGTETEACVEGLCQSMCFLTGSITGARLKQVLIAQNGDINDFPGNSGKTWCLGDYEFSVPVPPKKTASGVCVKVGTGINIGDNIADFTLTQCEGDGYDFSLQPELCGGETKVIWVVATAPWCGACSSWVPKMANAYERYKDKGLEIVVVLGEDTAKNPPTAGYCAAYGVDKGVDPKRMFMDNDAGRSWGILWDNVNNYSDGGIGLPWQAVLDGESMEYVWSSTAGAGTVTEAVCDLLGGCDPADPLIQ